jgi:sulfate adenylyltransferase subunit 1
VKIIFSEEMIFDDYEENKITGSLIFIDLVSNITVGAGMIRKGTQKKEKIIFDKNTKGFESDLYNLILKYFPYWQIKK